MIPRVKVCCIATVEEARLAVKHGASAVGLVSAMPSGPGPIPDEAIRRIAAAVPPGVATFLLTARTEAEAIVDQQRRARVNAIQLVDRVPAETLIESRRRLPGIGLVQVVHVVGPESLDEAAAVAPLVDALLLDSGDLDGEVKELGGTGRTHDWRVSRRIVETVPVPVFLAGGLGPGNAREAIRAVGPFGLDVCTGLRTGGALDESKLASFMVAVGVGARERSRAAGAGEPGA